jgi:hypothetical protein
VSLSNEPVFSMLKDQFVCGYKDIENKGYAGASHKHEPDGNAVDTTNGAGPHNIQIFVLDADGTVLTCLPGYWNAEDLASELQLAQRLDKVWRNQNLNRDQKDQLFRRIQLGHIADHSQAEHDRSRMQGFDISYEEKRHNTEVFNASHMNMRTGVVEKETPKTTDVMMHQRIAALPFVPYKKFDVAAFSDYGQPMYDKHENSLSDSGQRSGGGDGALIGNNPGAHPIKTEIIRQGSSHIPGGGMGLYGVEGLLKTLTH